MESGRLHHLVAAIVAPRLAAGPDRWLAPAWNAIAAEVAPRSGAFLDLAARRGWLCAYVASNRPDVDAIGLVSDPWRWALAERVRERRLNITFKDLPPSRVTWPAETFDTIVAVNAASLWDDPDVVLAEVWRLLRPTGKAYIYDANRDDPLVPGRLARAWLRRGAMDDAAWNALKAAVRRSPFGGGEEGSHGPFRRLVLGR